MDLIQDIGRVVKFVGQLLIGKEEVLRVPEGKIETLSTSRNINAGATVEIFRYQVPSYSKLFIIRFGNYINIFEAWGSITWVFKRNGIPISPYNTIQDQLGYPAQLGQCAGVKIAGGDVFSIDVINDFSDVVSCGISLAYEVR